jgi:hypothetical protein
MLVGLIDASRCPLASVDRGTEEISERAWLVNLSRQARGT